VPSINFQLAVYVSYMPLEHPPYYSKGTLLIIALTSTRT
jgi:hypothetical protein